MKLSVLDQLRCPFCAGNLSFVTPDRPADEVEYAVLARYCDSYPVVAGISILKKGVSGSGGQMVDKVVALLRPVSTARPCSR